MLFAALLKMRLPVSFILLCFLVSPSANAASWIFSVRDKVCGPIIGALRDSYVAIHRNIPGHYLKKGLSASARVEQILRLSLPKQVAAIELLSAFRSFDVPGSLELA